ncbi:MAG TPA: CvpA family protein [Terriglobia bacterium]|nr:CvpA family protein [Terriglobia bacterium]
MASLNWLDWILGIVLLVSVVTAVRRGIMAEVVSLATLIAGLIVAAEFYTRVATWFEDFTKSNDVALALAFLVLFLGVMAAGSLITWLVQKLVKKAGLQWFDRFMGGIFGVVRGVAIDCVILMVMMAFSIKPQAVARSAMAPYVSTGARALAYVMPRELRTEFSTGFDRFRQALVEATKSPG